MGLAIRIGIEIALVALLSFSAVGFWQTIKGRRYRKRITRDQEFLDSFIKTLNSEKPFSERTSEMEPIRGDWAWNMLLATRSDLGALSTLRNAYLVVCVAILIGSFFLGLVYLGINIAVFLFLAMPGVSGPAQNDALKQVLSIAQIMYRWKRDDRHGYESFLREAIGVRELASSIERYTT